MSPGIEFEDVSGQPRPIRDLEIALQAIQKEIVTNHATLFKDGSPAIMQYIVINEALQELIALRKAIEAHKSAKVPHAG